MHFKRIEMQGFKSFADPVTIELNDGITCIVGPNGSGKSNISDALRWVVGEQSPRSLRGGKMDDVIFAGTATRKPKSMAEVSLVIDNTSGFLPLEYSEVQVTRRMYRSGESEYLINGNQCRLRDIKELFMDTGIGVDGYSIIGQGKIQDIVSTKPENRREIFEEAAGVVLYKTRKQDAERKLRSAEENIDRVRDILGEIEGRIGGLKEESEKATEYLELKGRYRKVGVNLLLYSLDSLARSIASSKEELEALSLEVQSKEGRKAALEQEEEELRRGDEAGSEEEQQTNEELLHRMEEIHALTNRGQVNVEKIAALEKDLDRIEQVLRDTKEKLSREREHFEQLEMQEKQEHAEAEAELRRLTEKEAELNRAKTKQEAVRGKIEECKENILSLNNGTIAKRAEITTLKNYLEQLKERREQLSGKAGGRDAEEEEQRKKLLEAEEKLRLKEDEGRALTDKRNELIAELEELHRQRIRLREETEQLHTEYHRTQARKATIEEMESNYEGYNNAVRQLMQSHQKGIIGTVSQLITVPNGYETAVETALGASLQNLVCEDDEAAKEGVRMLKRTRAGRATFLPLASLRGKSLYPDARTAEAEGFLGLASEIVEAEDRYQVVLDYLLGRVLFADTMNHAVRLSKIAHQGYRIVTLDGEVINASGAITGGQYRNKSANLLARRHEVEDLTEKLASEEQRLQELRKAAEDIEQKEQELRRQLTEREEELSSLAIACGVLRTEKEHLEESAKASGSRAEELSKEMDILIEDIELAEKRIRDYEERIRAAEEQACETEAAAEALMAEEERYGLQAEELAEELTSIRLRTKELETKSFALNEMIERVRDTMQDYESTMEDAEAEKAEAEKEKELLGASDEAAAEKREKLETSKHELELRLERLRREREERRKRREALNAELKSLNEALSAESDRKYKLEVKRAKDETLSETQKDKLWDEFEMSYAEALEHRDPDFSVTAGNRESKAVKLRIAELGDVNIGSIEEYKQVSKRYEFMKDQEEDLERAMTELNDIISNMDRTIRTRFKENFDAVALNFEEIFKELFGGGHAELTLENEDDPLTSGIDIVAQPPGKRLKNINLMSGGEKTLTAIALMFAVLKAKPTPFCILDEVEAALDEANIERFSSYLRHFNEVQFALITHHKETMEHADVLYGVTMPEQGISRVLSLRLEDHFDPSEYTND